MRRISCSPSCDARQPGPPSVAKTDSMGNLGSSDVTSTVAICPRSIQCAPDDDRATVWAELTILFRTFLFSLKQEACTVGRPLRGYECQRCWLQCASHGCSC